MAFLFQRWYLSILFRAILYRNDPRADQVAAKCKLRRIPPSQPVVDSKRLGRGKWYQFTVSSRVVYSLDIVTHSAHPRGIASTNSFVISIGGRVSRSMIARRGPRNAADPCCCALPELPAFQSLMNRLVSRRDSKAIVVSHWRSIPLRGEPNRMRMNT